MDIEGAEYDILRDLMLRGLICRIEKLFVEVHAMRPFDSILPWLLGPCLEVFITQQYFLHPAVEKQWPEDDASCKSCPLLYRAAAVKGCPVSTAIHTCFDEVNTCETCCDLSFGLQGNP